ncbi:MAG: chorismate mutase [Bacteroidota bacterium]
MRRSTLNRLRDTIDLIDSNLVLLLHERQALVRQIGEVKKRRGSRIVDRNREREILRRQRAIASDLDLNDTLIAEMFRAIFKLARTTQKSIARR